MDEFKTCEYCGRSTNSKQRRCCIAGEAVDKETSKLRAEVTRLREQLAMVAHNISGSPATIMEWSKKVGNALLELDRLQQGGFEEKVSRLREQLAEREAEIKDRADTELSLTKELVKASIRAEAAESRYKRLLAAVNGDVSWIERSYRLEAAEARCAAMQEAGSELVDLMEAVVAGEYKPDSFTTQPMRLALSALDKEKP